MTDSNTQTPQFQTVEYATGPGNCVLCNQAIGGTYYRVNGQQACSSCAEKEKAAEGTSSKNYPRALMFGIGAAIVGMIGYAAFEILTGWIIGYVSLGVGWLVGAAMMKGAKGFGGRKYQITAVLLTYCAVSLAAIPVWISVLSKQHKENAPVVQKAPEARQTSQTGAEGQQSQPSGNPSGSVTFAGDSAPTQVGAQQASAPQTKPEKDSMSAGKAIGTLFLVGLASPFLDLADPFHGLIGLVILFVGMRIAWKMTARPALIIDGPF